MNNTKSTGKPSSPAAFPEKYDHDEVRCEVMAQSDEDNLLPGTPRTCCVCVGHDCAESKAERVKHPAFTSQNAGLHRTEPAAGSGTVGGVVRCSGSGD